MSIPFLPFLRHRVLEPVASFLRRVLGVPSRAEFETAINRAERRIGELDLALRKTARALESSQRLLSESERVSSRVTLAIYEAAESIQGMVAFLRELDASTEEELLVALRKLREKEQQHGQIIPGARHGDDERTDGRPD